MRGPMLHSERLARSFRFIVKGEIPSSLAQLLESLDDVAIDNPYRGNEFVPGGWMDIRVWTDGASQASLVALEAYHRSVADTRGHAAVMDQLIRDFQRDRPALEAFAP